MLHRRLTSGWLDDNSTVTSALLLLADSPEGTAAARHRASFELQHPLVPFFGRAATPAAYLAGHAADLAPLAPGAFPPNVHLLNLDAWAPGPPATVLLRLLHTHAVGEHPVLSRPATVDVGEALAPALGRGRCIVSFEERSLTGLWGKQQLRNGSRVTVGAGQATVVGKPWVVTLNPLQIRTFLFVVGECS
jgi:hypothetical protein